MLQTKITGITGLPRKIVQKVGSFIDNRAVSIGREMVGISIPKPRTSTTYPRITTERGLQGKTDDWIKVNLANEYGFVSSGKPVHPLYTDSIHCLGDAYTPNNDAPVVLGFDFGRTPACAFLQRDALGRWICFDEFCMTDSGAVDFAPSLKRYIDANYPQCKFRGWGDPSGDNKNQANADTPFKIMRAAGIPCTPTLSNDPSLRRAALEMPMKELCMDGKPRFLISPKAKMIRKGLQGGFCYRRLQLSGEKYTDEPDKNEYSSPGRGA